MLRPCTTPLHDVGLSRAMQTAGYPSQADPDSWSPHHCFPTQAAMASFHFASLIHLPPTEVRQPQLWDRIRTWVALTETLFTPAQLAQYGLRDATAEVKSGRACPASDGSA